MERRREFAGVRSWRLTLRELPWPGDCVVQILLMLMVGAALAVIGPFGTYYDLGLGPRFAYWMSSMLLIGVPAGLMLRVLARRDPGESWPIPAQALATAVIIGLPSTFVVIALQTIFRETPPITVTTLARLYGDVTLMIGLISLPFAYVFHAHYARHTPASAVAARVVEDVTPISATTREAADAATPSVSAGGAVNGSPFLRRLPAKLGTDLRYIATEDHYLRVTTDQGSDLILFRLADAMAELDPAIGQQVHRSYWVARRAIASVERDGHRTWLILADGARIPVSRTYLPALREAGWLGA